MSRKTLGKYNNCCYHIVSLSLSQSIVVDLCFPVLSCILFFDVRQLKRPRNKPTSGLSTRGGFPFKTPTPRVIGDWHWVGGFRYAVRHQHVEMVSDHDDAGEPPLHDLHVMHAEATAKVDTNYSWGGTYRLSYPQDHPKPFNGRSCGSCGLGIPYRMYGDIPWLSGEHFHAHFLAVHHELPMVRHRFQCPCVTLPGFRSLPLRRFLCGCNSCGYLHDWL